MGGYLSTRERVIRNRYNNDYEFIPIDYGYDSTSLHYLTNRYNDTLNSRTNNRITNIITNIRDKTYVNHTQLPNNFNIESKIPKFSRNDPVHVIYSNNTYNAVTITGISHKTSKTIFYNFEYNFGTSEGTAAEENLYLRDVNDNSRNDHLSNINYNSYRYSEENLELLDKYVNRFKSINLDYNNLVTTKSKEIVCSICLGDDKDNEANEANEDNLKYKLPNCTHFYHKDCIDKWIKLNNNSCPTCRTVIR